ncbi:MAG: 4-(cytidine 5'-diphospho)-2-C-methyl-D-erythritol kinase [Crocinitomicaceae bacterium]|nr:4-(cytidine 5'-diphospho)-2-C-methyl-D-erythritol kinase [Crocinitomicaceae bacterium]
MILFSHAKINIGLYVTSKRADGFHNIESVFYPIPFYDLIELLPYEKDVFSTSGLEIPPGPNLVQEAYELLKKDFKLGKTFIHLHKRIPLGSGLGGGSSNAAFTLMGLNYLYDLGLSKEQLMDYAAQLGSDCPFFIQDHPCLVKGRGEIMEAIDLDLSGFYLKLIHTGIHVSTPMAYRFIQPNNRSLHINFLSDYNPFKNDFEEVVFGMHPELKVIKEKLLQEGAFYASMTGSGSAIYGLFENKPAKTGGYLFEEIMELKQP